MQKEKRNKQKPIPNNIQDFLNETQIMALRQFESYGWRLEFIRRPLFQTPTPVIFGPNNDIVGILLEDGTIDKKPTINIRSE
jgi:hypothetical protein